MVLLRFLCFVFSCILPLVHMAEEKKTRVGANISLPKVPTHIQPFLIEQEAEVNQQAEEVNADVFDFKEEIAAIWRLPGMEKVLTMKFSLAVKF